MKRHPVNWCHHTLSFLSKSTNLGTYSVSYDIRKPSNSEVKINSCLYKQTHTHMQILLQPARGYATWQSQDACVLSRHCAGEQALPHSKWCGHPSPTWTIAVSWEKALNLHPSKCQVPRQSQLGGLVGLVGGRWKIRWKIAWVGLELGGGTSGPEPRT